MADAYVDQSMIPDRVHINLEDFHATARSLDVAAAVVVTAAVLPFVQSLATQAGQLAFDAARGLVKSLSRKNGQDLSGHRILTVRDEGGPVTFQVPAGLPDDALRALAVTDIEALAAVDPDGGEVIICWDPEAARWQRTVLRLRPT
ncbi:hypothetical protein [Streptomyces sp. NPDC059881]|uniref:hypothetical protein n=1 Tax=Streptomyces sp. NPDC059881 TaxID=3346986 RepID=UPI00365A1E4F